MSFKLLKEFPIYFKPFNFNNPDLSAPETITALAYNLWKLIYYYDQDKLESLSQKLLPLEAASFLQKQDNIQAQEAAIYFRTLAGIYGKKFSQEESDEFFGYILDYLMAKEEALQNFEISNEKAFQDWFNNYGMKIIKINNDIVAYV